jgi:tetratricopeptide (TPR) repeat protein
MFAGSTTGDNMRMFLQERSTVLPTSISLGDNQEALFAAAQTALFLQDYDRAGVYISALAKDHSTAQTEIVRGDWLVATKNFTDARAAFSNAERLDPSSISARMGLATAALQDRDYDTSERVLREVLERDPGYLPGLETYALVEAGRGDWKEALTWQTKRVLGDPSQPFKDVLFLADLLVRNGDNQDAERLYVELLNRDPYNGAARTSLGELYRSEHRWEEARVQFEVAIRYFPIAGTDEYLSLADVYRKMGRIQDAQYCLEQGEKLFPQNASLFRSPDGY